MWILEFRLIGSIRISRLLLDVGLLASRVTLMFRYLWAVRVVLRLIRFVGRVRRLILAALTASGLPFGCCRLRCLFLRRVLFLLTRW